MNNGLADGHPAANGSSSDVPPLDPAQLIYALQVVYDPRTPNETRKDATAYLEQAKAQSDAPSQGYMLASDRSQPPPTRHFGLSLLEFPIRHRWDSFNTDQTRMLRTWVIQLAESVVDSEPLYFRNKIAQLWVDVAERSWTVDWQDMDSALCKLWGGHPAQQELVLHILETLSDVIFSSDGTVTSPARTGDLGKACVEVFTPASLLGRIFPEREFDYVTRSGEEGWLPRLSESLSRCLEMDVSNQAQVQNLVVKILAVMQTVMPWIPLKAVAQSNCVELFCKCLEVREAPVQMAAVETMHALYHRAPFTDEDVIKLVCPLLSSEGIVLFSGVFSSTYVKVEDMDDGPYAMLKKLSEVMCALATFLEQRPRLVAEHSDVPSFLGFLLIVLQHQSLVVSIPVLYSWTRLLSSSALTKSEVFSPIIGPLLEICTNRLLRYESLPADNEDVTFAFLHEDFDTMPERHAFVGNYRRFCVDVIEKIVRKSPFEAVRHLLSRADQVLMNLYDLQQPFSRQNFTTNSAAILRVDTQYTVVTIAIKSYVKWLASHRSKNFPEQESKALISDLEEWCRRLMSANFEDPVIAKRILQLLIELALYALPQTSNVCLSICQYVFTQRVVSIQGNSTFDEALRDLQAIQPRELQRLANTFSDPLYAVLPELESKVVFILQEAETEQRIKLDYQAFLFSIILRTSSINDDERRGRLREIIKPAVESWMDPNFQGLLGSFDSFRTWLGLDQACRIFIDNNAARVDDWSMFPLDSQALDIKNNVSNQIQKTPLHATRSLLFASTDRARVGASDFTRALWQDAVAIVLPRLLQCISNAHAFNNPNNWSAYPPDMQSILNRILVDRVWQSGISAESRDDFYERVRNSKNSLEGLASAIRGAVRGVREVSYWIVHCMSGLGEIFYHQEGLPEALSRSLYTEAHTLSTHQLSALLKLSSALIDGCPAGFRAQFLPPVVTALFKQLDVKITAEWSSIEQRKENKTEEEDLDQEMKAESVLRALTHAAIMQLSSLMGYQRQPGSGDMLRHDQSPTDVAPDDQTISIRKLCLSSPDMLEALMMFCTTALRVHDSRCCGIVTRTLRSIIPEFAEHKGYRSYQSEPTLLTNEFFSMSLANSPETIPRPTVRPTSTTLPNPPPFAPQIREFFSNIVLTAAITSLHEPYFVDLQKDLAALIAAILATYYPSTTTPRTILLSLPGMNPTEVDTGLAEIANEKTGRGQRTWVLKLLDSVRGVGLHELGKIDAGGTGKGVKKTRSKMQEAFMAVDEPVKIERGDTPDLGGMADLFG